MHDEFLYQLKADELFKMIPLIEAAMIKGMTKIIPDVRIGVETTIGKWWNKKGVTFDKLELDEQGQPKILIPDFVKSIEHIA